MTESQTLPPPETAAAVEALLQGSAQLLRRLRSESNPDRLSWSQGSALVQLDRLGPMTTADLARAEAVKPQSIGATLASLEADSLVERRPHPTDGRQVLFALSAAGEDMRRRRQHMKVEWLTRAMDRLTPEERRTLQAAADLIRRMADS